MSKKLVQVLLFLVLHQCLVSSSPYLPLDTEERRPEQEIEARRVEDFLDYYLSKDFSIYTLNMTGFTRA
jgi:hypothetical protein